MARRRRPMSAATKAKISAAQKGNKNAYKGGPKKKSTKPGRGQLGGKRGNDGFKQIRNKGYGKRRAVFNAVGTATAATLALTAVKNTKGVTRSGPKGQARRRAVGIGTGASVAIALRVHKSHKLGMAKRKAKKEGKSFAVRKRNGKVNVYNPAMSRRQKRKSTKKKK